MVGYIPVLPRSRLQRLPEFIERVQQSHYPPGPGDLGPRVMLHYDGRVGDLRPFLWPTVNNERVTPDKLDAHRLTHYFLGPSCLCAFLDVGNHTESVIGLAQMVMDPNSKYAGEYLGQYVAMCAQQRCGYFVILEHFFTHHSLPVQEYVKRQKPLTFTDPFLFMTDDTEETARYSGLRQILILGQNDNNALRGSRKLLKRQDPHAFRDMEDDMEQLITKGVDAEKFWNLFVQCTQCRVVLPRHHYPYMHACAVKVYEGTMERYKATFRELQSRLRAEEAEADRRRAEAGAKAASSSQARGGGLGSNADDKAFDSGSEWGGVAEGQGEDEGADDHDGAISEASGSDLGSLPSDPYVAMFGERQ